MSTPSEPVAVEYGARCTMPCCGHTEHEAPFMVNRDRESVEDWIASQSGQYLLVSRPVYGWQEVTE